MTYIPLGRTDSSINTYNLFTKTCAVLLSSAVSQQDRILRCFALNVIFNIQMMNLVCKTDCTCFCINVLQRHNVSTHNDNTTWILTKNSIYFMQK